MPAHTKDPADRCRKWNVRKEVIDTADQQTDEVAACLARAHRMRLIRLDQRTPYAPGCREKVAVLTARYHLGLPMHVDGEHQ
mgnify:CR=1 FL=1